MDPAISKEEREELENIKGQVKGVALKENLEFVLKEEGKEGLTRLEKEIAKMEIPLKYEEIKAMTFYPLWWDAVLLLTIKRLFRYDNQKFQDMGRFEPKISFIIRIFMKYFVSLEKAAQETSKMWRQTFTVGDLEVGGFNKKERSGTLILKNYRLIPLQCEILKGYFSSVLQMIVGKEVEAEETKCIFEGDEYHEFSFKW